MVALVWLAVWIHRNKFDITTSLKRSKLLYLCQGGRVGCYLTELAIERTADSFVNQLALQLLDAKLLDRNGF